MNTSPFLVAITNHLAAVEASNGHIGTTRVHGRKLGFALGRDFAKVFAVESNGSRSAIMFVAVQGGDMFRAASWKARSSVRVGNLYALNEAMALKAVA